MFRQSLGKSLARLYAPRVLTQPEAPQEFPPVLTAALAADLLQVHVEYLRKMVRDGRVPCHRFPGGRELRFLRDELLEWLADLPGQNRVGVNVSDQSCDARTQATDDVGTNESIPSRERTRT
jgi:excisionase family DNA binding protein